MLTAIMHIAAVLTLAYFAYRLIVAGYNLLTGIFYSWIDPHTNNGTLYLDYVKIGDRIGRVRNYRDFAKVARHVQAFAEAAGENSEAKAFSDNLYGLLHRKQLQLRMHTAYGHALN